MRMVYVCGMTSNLPYAHCKLAGVPTLASHGLHSKGQLDRSRSSVVARKETCVWL